MLKRDERGAVLGEVALRNLFLRDQAAGGETVLPTPAYVYDLDAIAAEARALRAGFGAARHLCAYAVKACSAGPVVRALVSEGCGADVVSGGELALAMGAGVDARKLLFSGAAKQSWEIDRAIGAGEGGILALQIESVEEIARVEARAKALGKKGRVSIRVNPGVVADTHAHVATGHDEAKFGVSTADLPRAYEALASAKNLSLVGLSSHVGSQLTKTGEYLAAAEVLLGLGADARKRGHALELIDFGGGFGVDYGAGCPVTPADFARAAVKMLAGSELRDLCLVVEPGRSLVAAHGVLVASVVGEKRAGDRRWVFLDAGMNDLLRPALYAAHHRIEPLEGATVPREAKVRIAGPVCESSDDFGEHDFAIGGALPSHMVIRDAGAYGFTMASEYNARPLPTEVFLSGGKVVGTIVPRGVDAWVAERLGGSR